MADFGDILNSAFQQTSNPGQSIDQGMQLGLQARQLDQTYDYQQKQLELEQQKLKDAHMNWGLSALEKGFALAPSAQKTFFDGIQEPMKRLTGVDTGNPAFQAYLKIDPEKNASTMNQIITYAKQAQNDPTATPELKAKSFAMLQDVGKAIGMNNPKDISDTLDKIYSSVGQGLQGKLSPDQDVLKSTITDLAKKALDLPGRFSAAGIPLSPEAQALNAAALSFTKDPQKVFNSPQISQQYLDQLGGLMNKAENQLGARQDFTTQKKEFQSLSDSLRSSLVGAADVRGQESKVAGLANTIDKANALAETNPSAAKQLLNGLLPQIGKLQGVKQDIAYGDVVNKAELDETKDVNNKLQVIRQSRSRVDAAKSQLDTLINKVKNGGQISDMDFKTIQSSLALMEGETRGLTAYKEMNTDVRTNNEKLFASIGSWLGQSTNASQMSVERLSDFAQRLKQGYDEGQKSILMGLRSGASSAAQGSSNPLIQNSFGNKSGASKILDNELKRFNVAPKADVAAKGASYFMKKIESDPQYKNYSPAQKAQAVKVLMQQLNGGQ